MDGNAAEVWNAVRGALKSSRLEPAIERGKRTDDPPLSFAQEGIWLHEQLFPGCGAYNTTLALELTGDLEIQILRSALENVIKSHEVLRTCITMGEGLPRQQISEEVPLEMGVVDLGQLASEDRMLEVRRLALAENMKIFDLQRSPMWRFTLFRLADSKHVLLLAVHHLIWDQSSYSIFLNQLCAEFSGLVNHGQSPSRGLDVQYADFARWEREQATADRQRPHVEYWGKLLDGRLRQLELPLDKPHPQKPAFSGRSRWFQLQDQQSARVKKLCQESGATPFMVFLTAFAALLARYGNDHDIIIATPFSKRQRRELMQMIGPLINLLLLPINVHGNPTARQCLQRVQEVVLDGFAHQDAPYEKVLAVVNSDRNRHGRPPVQAMFTFYRMPLQTTTESGLSFRPFDVEDGKARLDVELFVWEAPDGFHGRFIFDTDIFKNETMDRITEHYQNLLRGILTEPDRRLLQLPLLTEREKQLLVEWSGQTNGHPQNAFIHELFEAQVLKSPDAPAVVHRGCVLSYAELNREANRLARFLKMRGADSSGLVATYLERNPDLLISLLAILKSGNAYVALDPSDPPNRTGLMLSDCGAGLLLTTRENQRRLSHPDEHTVVLEELTEADLESETTPSAAETDCLATNYDQNDNSSRLAYVTYTSGSTGTPKGIAVPHRAIVDMVCDVDYLTVGPGDRMAQAANVSFDVSTSEIWGALANGGMLVMLSRETILSPTALEAALEEHRIDTLFLTTALFNRVASEAPSAFRGLRDLLVGGEILESTWVNRVLTHGAPERLLNVYGPTEATVYSTWFQIEKVEESGSRIPIGRAIGRKKVYVLDAGLQPVPVGVAGEICIGGPGLALGYLGQQTLTDEYFVADPFTAEEGARLYRTGDRGRFLTDGNLEFLGRIDGQVKIRGNRIELGEIEATLSLHPGVSECAVAVRLVPAIDDRPEDKRLVAFVVPAQEQPPQVAELRRFLKTRIPSAMLPSTFVPIEAIPLTATGKVDRSVLNNLAPGQHQQTEESIEPHNEIERQLVKIWKRVLWLDHDVGIHDNFFDLGGHSLLASVLVAEIEKVLNTKIPISALFRLNTVSELAGHLEPMIGALSETLRRGLTDPDSETAMKPSDLPEHVFHRLLAFTAGWEGERVSPEGGLMVGLNLAGRNPPLFWCFQGFAELQQLARFLGKSQPTYGMRSGHLAMQVTAENIRALAAHYVEEILSVTPDGPYLIGGNCQGAYIAWAIAEELKRQDRQVALLAMQLMDYRHALPFSGRVALFFGAEFSDLSSSPEVPEPVWTELYPAGFTVDSIPGTHRWHFVDPNIQVFARKIEHRLRQAYPLARTQNTGAVEKSRGVVVLGMHGRGPTDVTDLLSRVWKMTGEGDSLSANSEVSEIHDQFFKTIGWRWHDPEILSDEVFRSENATAARVRLREVTKQLAGNKRWVLADPRMCRLLPLWAGLFPGNVDVHFLHVFRSPLAVADFMQKELGFHRERSLFLWLIHHLDAELKTRNRKRSWLCLEELSPPLQTGGVEALRAAVGAVDFSDCPVEEIIQEAVVERQRIFDIDEYPASDGLRFQPWVATTHRALMGFFQGREVESRVILDAVRSGFDSQNRTRELDRLQDAIDRLREENHRVWKESINLQHELKAVAASEEKSREELWLAEHERQMAQQQLLAFQQRKSWKLLAPLRWLNSVARGRLGSG